MSKAVLLAFVLGAASAAVVTWIALDLDRPALAQGVIAGPVGSWQLIPDGQGNAWRFNTAVGAVFYCSPLRCFQAQLQ